MARRAKVTVNRSDLMTSGGAMVISALVLSLIVTEYDVSDGGEWAFTLVSMSVFFVPVLAALGFTLLAVGWALKELPSEAETTKKIDPPIPRV
jgi:hypothetical protein